MTTMFGCIQRAVDTGDVDKARRRVIQVENDQLF